MEFNIIALGLFGVIMWLFICLRATRGSFGWVSPASLLAIGLLVLYIIPSLYWQFRPWNYRIPPYFDGLPIVLIGAIVFGLSFIPDALRKLSYPKKYLKTSSITDRYGWGLWVCVVPVLLGVGWRFYLITQGYQSRLSRVSPELFGSEELAYLFGNITYYYAAFYFALFALGNKSQRQIGVLFWISDGILQVYTLHRYVILLFVFRSIVFLTLIGVKFSKKQWVSIVFSVVFVISVIGATSFLASQSITGERSYLTPGQAVEVVGQITERLFVDASGNFSFMFATLDDTMYRLYEARSASAVMFNVPDVIPYFKGETFKQVFYSFIPRYLWPGKPDLYDIQSITILVMPDDEGVNPAGTLAELYMNFGFPVILLGGFLCFLLCKWTDYYLNRKYLSPALICVYPIIAELFVAANMSLTRRLCEGVRGIMLLMALMWFFNLCRQKLRGVGGQNWNIENNGGYVDVE